MSYARLTFHPNYSDTDPHLVANYTVFAQLQRANQRTMRCQGNLPSAHHLIELNHQWRQQYNGLIPDPLIIISDSGETSDSTYSVIDREILDHLSEQMRTQINLWFSSPNFANVVNALNIYFNEWNRILVTIETENEDLIRLPLHLWQFFTHFPNAELIYSRNIHIIEGEHD